MKLADVLKLRDEGIDIKRPSELFGGPLGYKPVSRPADKPKERPAFELKDEL